MIESRHTSTSAITGKRKQRRRGFTLVELLMVIALIGMLSSMLLVSLYAAAQSAKVRRTEQQIERIHTLLMSRWESYQYRPLPIKTSFFLTEALWTEWNLIGCELGPPPPSPDTHVGKWTMADDRAKMRLWAIRELMRLEMPERKSDVAPNVGAPVTPSLTPPSLWKSYQRRVARLWGNPDWHLVSPVTNAAGKAQTWTEAYQGAECLYMILGSIREGDRNGLDFFTEDEIGDVDGDQMKEILDGWGKPIDFLRWAPGFFGPGVSDLQTGDRVPGVDGDSGDGGNILDPLKVDPLWKDSIPHNDPFLLVPLVFSYGPDSESGIATRQPGVFIYTLDGSPYSNCPFRFDPGSGRRFGDRVPGKELDSFDNISNHLIGQ